MHSRDIVSHTVHVQSSLCSTMVFGTCGDRDGRSRGDWCEASPNKLSTFLRQIRERQSSRSQAAWYIIVERFFIARLGSRACAPRHVANTVCSRRTSFPERHADSWKYDHDRMCDDNRMLSRDKKSQDVPVRKGTAGRRQRYTPFLLPSRSRQAPRQAERYLVVLSLSLATALKVPLSCLHRDRHSSIRLPRKEDHPTSFPQLKQPAEVLCRMTRSRVPSPVRCATSVQL